MFLAAVIVSAWYGGLGPGLLATAIAALARPSFVSPAERLLHLPDAATIVHIVILVGVAVLVSSLTGALRRAEHTNHALAEAEHAARLDAQAANRTKDVFLAKISHELRTPLQATTAWATLLGRSRHDDLAFGKALAVLQRSIAAQSSLIDDLLIASRLTTGKMHLDRKAVRPGPVIEAAVATAMAAARQPQPTVTVSLDPAAGAVAGDVARLEQVVSNLVSNALKFTAPSGRVDVRLEHADHAVRIVVADAGRGIAREMLPHLFDDFWQGPSAVESSPGLGLGLAIVRQIVDLHGGIVHADSPGLGSGATFTVTLPLDHPPTADNSAESSDRMSPVEYPRAC